MGIVSRAEHLARRAPQLDPLPGVPPAMLENTVQGGQQLGGAVHDAIEPATGKQPVADLQEILGGRIQVANGQANRQAPGIGQAHLDQALHQIGGIGGLAPERRSEIARFGLRAMVAGKEIA